jgi:hypothetical protein
MSKRTITIIVGLFTASCIYWWAVLSGRASAAVTIAVGVVGLGLLILLIVRPWVFFGVSGIWAVCFGLMVLTVDGHLWGLLMMAVGLPSAVIGWTKSRKYETKNKDPYNIL